MKKSNRLQTILKMTKFLMEQRHYFKAVKRLDQVRVILMRANVELGKKNYHDPLYANYVESFNLAMIYLSQAKWHTTQGSLTRSRQAWKLAFASIAKADKLANMLLAAVPNNIPLQLQNYGITLTSNGTEIQFADSVPLVPEICPVVVLQGSDYEMGRQYAQQVIQIYGAWVFQRKAGRHFSETELAVIHNWEKQIEQYAPEILEFCRGWADGACSTGIQMSYVDVLELWTDHRPPATNYLGFGESLPIQLPQVACSGAAAWGKATKDGRLVTGSTGDHDLTPMVTIMAYPETGNNYMITPFSVNGEVREVGSTYMMGHPGINNKGLAYVEHGGGPKMVEAKDQWGYGVRLGTAVFHILRFANSASEAREMELSLPIGDVGRPLGTAGGFWADSTYGYILESRKDPLVLRESGVLGEIDFLYANNNTAHPDSGQAGWMQKDKLNWRWDPRGGWHPVHFSSLTMANIFKKTVEDRIVSALSLAYESSRGRNVYFNGALSKSVGQIDLDTMKSVFRKSGSFPQGSWKELTEKYQKTGQWGEYSTGHATNALVVVTQPDNGDGGIYSVCSGTAARGLTSNTPTRACPIYNETNAFWELKLAATPQEVLVYARQKAEDLLRQSEIELDKLGPDSIAYLSLHSLIDQAKHEYQLGLEYSENASRSHAVDDFSRAIRAMTRAQVRALQVLQALVPSQ